MMIFRVCFVLYLNSKFFKDYLFYRCFHSSASRKKQTRMGTRKTPNCQANGRYARVVYTIFVQSPTLPVRVAEYSEKSPNFRQSDFHTGAHKSNMRISHSLSGKKRSHNNVSKALISISTISI